MLCVFSKDLKNLIYKIRELLGILFDAVMRQIVAQLQLHLAAGFHLTKQGDELIEFCHLMVSELE